MKRFGGSEVLHRWLVRRPSSAFLTAICAAGLAIVLTANAAHAQLTSLRVQDYATAPMTGVTTFPAPAANPSYLARVNFMNDEPGTDDRFFVNDLNGQLYILNKNTRVFTEYLNFNGTSRNNGLFDRLYFAEGGFGAGLVTFEFDPDYVNNGKFYTVHMESGAAGTQVPTHPNLDSSNFGVTTSIDEPGNPSRQQVIVEWTDTNISNSAFEGSARELFRMDMRDRIHPIGDIAFNPTAGPSDPDWRMMYVAIGDAGNGEQSDPNIRRTNQLLNTYGGKILRIAPDANVNIPTTTSPNGKYLIPTDNPFTGVANPGGTNGAVRDEIYALGFRNPHRLSWDVDPSNTNNNQLIVNDIGLHTWEEVNLVHRGANYGYSLREGNQLLQTNNSTAALPGVDTIPDMQICTGASFNSCTSNGTVTPTYPVAQYGHGLLGQSPFFAGDSISSGFVYRGSLIPELYGKYLFGDITTGAIYYADYAEMLAADDGNPATLAAINSLDILWDNPNDAPNDGEELYTTLTTSGAIRGPLFQMVDAAYHFRGGQDPNLPGGAAVTDPFGRSDIRLSVDDNGELYILSKSDGMIRAIVPIVPEPASWLLMLSALLLVSAARRRGA